MNTRYKIALAGLVLVVSLAASALVIGASRSQRGEAALPGPLPQQEEVIATSSAPQSASASAGASNLEIKKISVTLSVSGTTATVSLPESSNVFDAMTALKKEGKIDFDATYHSALGYFIERIAGKKNAGGYYWTLYINDGYSNSGASQTILRDGDRIEWKYTNNPLN